MGGLPMSCQKLRMAVRTALRAVAAWRFCALAIDESFVPPTINYENPDPECDLDYTPNVGVAKDIRVALSSSLGFGGHNGILVFKKH